MNPKSILVLAAIAMTPSLWTSCRPELSMVPAAAPSTTNVAERVTATVAIERQPASGKDSPTPTPAPPARPTATAQAAEVPAVAAPTQTGTAPRFPHYEVVFIRHGNRGARQVALTFDLCQRPENPAGFDREIVDVLLEYQAPATFFVGGHWAITHPRETQWLASIPLFEIGNHSWSHPDLPDLTEEEISREILRAQDVLWQLTGISPRLFRLPAGKYNDLVLSVVAWHGLYTIQWDVDTGDPVFDTTPEVLAKNVRDRTQNGSIILMHANGRGWHTAEALPSMIEFLRGEGYELVRVSELLDRETPSAGSAVHDRRVE